MMTRPGHIRFFHTIAGKLSVDFLQISENVLFQYDAEIYYRDASFLISIIYIFHSNDAEFSHVWEYIGEGNTGRVQRGA
jgi:hypothetical protein